MARSSCTLASRMCWRSCRPKASLDNRPRKCVSAPSLPQRDRGVHRSARGQRQPGRAERVVAVGVCLDQVDQGLPAHHEARHGDNLVVWTWRGLAAGLIQSAIRSATRVQRGVQPASLPACAAKEMAEALVR